MPIHRGPRLDDMISRLAYRATPIQANVYKTWPNLAIPLTVLIGSPGPWTEFISAANAPTVPFTITHVYMEQAWSGLNTFEIGTGTAGAEVVVGSCSQVSFYNFTHHTSSPNPMPIIPGGTRVAIRFYGGYERAYVKIVSAILPARLDPFNTLRMASKFSTQYAGLTPMYQSSAETASGAIWTYGSYVEVSASTMEPNPSIITGVTCKYTSQSTADRAQAAFATGAAGAEVVWGEFPFYAVNNDANGIELPIPIIVPGSTRHAAKYANGLATQSSTLMPHFIKGGYMP